MAYFSDVLSPCLCAGCWSTGGGAGNGLNAFTLHSFAFLPICSHIKFNHFRPSSFQGNFHCYYKLHCIIVIYSISTILRALLPSGAFYFEVFSMGDERRRISQELCWFGVRGLCLMETTSQPNAF